ncbi:hypothetical protein PR003_g878 [Phytophthora rubi]|uniref:Uncharacterized protein n=1 Tax=Phytophthora rubi TaxID=129364 RepID=A0A6A3P2R1_9STRA|nr:hypothetical protein PR002_g769 [Phytophthora rubi]KAE9052321.1 hypothetical protein PR001_g631 [Phytophthora rubi]KAE9359220.1 hypothetical protein PR003_g878 [Phytophthora rubi]
MRQSVHPMEANADSEKRRKLGMDDDDWQDLATENSSESVQPETTDHWHSTNYRGPSFGDDPTTAPDFMTQDNTPSNDLPPAARPPLVTRSGNAKVNGTSEANGNEFEDDEIDGAAEVLPTPRTGGAEFSVTRTGRQLTFADETGGALVEMNYSNRTHYSKQAGPGTVQGVPKGGCCAIQ